MVAAATLDPTLQTLKALDDPSKWEVKRGVPIFKAHKRVKDGKVLYEIKDEDLPEIAEEMHRLEKEEGVFPLLTLGHRKRDGHEKDQPKPVGLARKLRLGTYGPKRKPALVADLYYRKEDFDEARKYPFRSVEYYPSTNTITSIALLIRDPELDLGMLTFTRTKPCYFYEANAMPDETNLKDDSLGSTEEEEQDEEELETPAGEAEEEEEAVLTPEEEKKFAGYMKKKFPHFEKMYGEQAKKYAAVPPPASTPAFPSGSNGTPPMPQPRRKPGAQAVPGQQMQRGKAPVTGARDQRSIEQMSRREQAEVFQKMRQEIDELKSEAKASKKKVAVSEATRTVDALDREGYIIPDRDRLIQRFARMDEDGRQEYEAEIRDHWTQVPIDRPMVQLSEGPRQAEFGEEHMEAALEYQRMHPAEFKDLDTEVAWEKAMSMVKTGKAKVKPRQRETA